MDLLNYILNEVKNKRIEKGAAVRLIRQYQNNSGEPGTARLHPLLHCNTSDLHGLRFSTTLTGREFFLSDHVAGGKPVLPAVACLEMVREALLQAGEVAAGAGVRLQEVVWSGPLAVEAAPVVLHVGLYQADQADPGAREFEIYGDDDVLYGQGKAGSLVPEPAERVDLAALRAQCSEPVLAGSEWYERFAAQGLVYGPALRTVETLHAGAGHVLARLQLPPAVAATAADYVLHPALLEGAVQAMMGLAGDEGLAPPALQLAIAEIQVIGRCSPQMWAWVRPSAGSTADTRQYDMLLCDDAGTVAVRCLGVTPKRDASAPAAADVLLLQPQWQPQAAAAVVHAKVPAKVPTYQEHHVVLCGLGVAASAVQARLGGANCSELPAGADPAADYGAAVQRLCLEVQGLLRRKPAGPVLLQVVVPAEGPWQVLAGLAGVLKSARQEQPKLVGQLIAVDAADAASVADRLAENAACPQDTEIRYAAGQRLLAGWQELAPLPAPPSPWKAGGVYLITGGLGGLGQLFAAEIARQAPGAVLVLTGRRPLDAPGEEAGRQPLRALEALGATVEYRVVDVADRDAVRQLLLQVQEDHQALHGIVHAAGVLRDSLLLKKTPEEIAAVLAPKVAGLLNLDEASRDIPLDWLICFSSTTAVLGNVGQADYAAANAFLDSYAHYRNGLAEQGLRHGRMVSVNWPLWKDGGMQIDAASVRLLEQSLGLTALESGAGIAALYQALAAGPAQVLVQSGSAVRIRQRLLARPEPVAQGPAEAPALTAADLERLDEKVRRLLWSAVARLLKVTPESLDGDAELSEFGLDSVMLTELSARFNQDYQVALAPTVFFEHPTLNRFARYLAQEHQAVFAARLLAPAGNRPAPAAAPDLPAPAGRRRARPRPAGATVAAGGPASAREPIAIIGMSGRFPMAPDLQAFWENLRDERDCISEIPPERWDWQALYGDPASGENKTNIKWGSFIDGVDEFDPLFFGISPKEAEVMDPQQRLLMMYVWKAIEDAGYAPGSLSGSRTAIYVGTSSSGYGNLLFHSRLAIEGYSATGMVPSVGPNRMSFLLNLHGPSEPVETACSSSLIALRKGVLAIDSGGCELAIVGGVNTIVTPEAHIGLNKAGMLAEDGRCKTFSAQANGYVRGEGVAMLVLKRLSAAERDGDHIYGVIRGTSENHGGRATSLTAPNPVAQAELVKAACLDAGVDARTISYIEAHGSGTPLGDPIEINGLKTAFSALYQAAGAAPPAEPHCGVGAVKSNIGHLELAAGIAGVVKVLLQLKHRTLVKSLHCEEVNPYIDLEGSPFYLVRETQAWPALHDAQGHPLPRRAGVSSFGFGGVNAHAVIEEYVAPAGTGPVYPVTPEHPALIVLSAKHAERLREQAQQLLAEIERQGWGDDRLGDLAYTLQVGRDAMEERLALLAGSMAQLKEKLAAFVAGQEGIDDLFRGQVKRNKEALAAFTADDDMARAVESWIAKGKLHKLLDLWVKGLAFDWNKLYGERRPRRMSLPTYPFARERYWVPEQAAHAPAEAGDAPAVLHPLLHRNTSDFSEQRFSSRFSGNEFFLADHVVQGRRVLPGVAYLEMAREALVQAGDVPAAAGVRLKDVVWARPVVVGDMPVELHVGLFEEAQGAVGFEIYSGDEVIHSQGTVETFLPGPAERLDLAALRAQCDGALLAGSDCYARFAAAGLEYGPAQRAVECIHVGTGQALARLRLPAGMAATVSDYLLHPSLLDGAVQAPAGLAVEGESSPLALPFAVGEVEIVGRCSPQMWALVKVGRESTAQVRKYDISLCDDDGTVVVRLKGFASRVVEGRLAAAAAAGPASVLLLEPQWRPQAAAMEMPDYQEWRVFSGGAVAAAELQARLGGADCSGLPDGELSGAYEAAVCQLCAELQSILQRRPAGPVLLQVVVPAGGPRQALAGLGGLLKTATQEMPKLVAQLIAVGEDETADSLSAKLAENAASPQDMAIRYVDGERQVEGWHELAGELPERMPWRAGGAYLITGGLGGLGRLFALEMARQAAGATLVLTGRRLLDDAGRQTVRALEALGATVEYRAVDVADRDAVRQLVLQVQEDHQALHGIVHAAGLLRDSLLLKKTPDEIAAVLAPKVAGLLNLDEASRDVELDWLISFSSVAATLGNVGQADYAAANGFLDGFSRYRNELVAQGRRHGRTVSVNWPLWQEGGMQIAAAAVEAMSQAAGLVPLASADGLQALYRIWGSGGAQVMVQAGVAARIRQRLLGLPVRTGPRTAASLAPAGTDDGQLEEQVRRLLLNAVSAMLKVKPEDIDGEAELSEFGLDSVMVTEFSNRLTQELKVALTPTAFFEYPTLNRFAQYLAQEHRATLAERLQTPAAADRPGPEAGAAPAEAEPAPAPGGLRRRPRRRPGGTVAAVAAPAVAEPIAIIGISGCFPMARDLDEFWSNLLGEKDCITEVPASRWDWRQMYGDPQREENRTNVKWAGFIDGVDEFDPLFFGISPKEAEMMDPQQRLLMTYVWKAIEDAGYAPGSLSGSRTALYVGTAASGYESLLARAGLAIEGYSATGVVPSVGPNRMSFLLNLHGPSEPVETACSSSLIALRKGVVAIESGGCELAIVGGVNTIVTPGAHISFSKAGMLCEDGRCKTFSAQANGYVRGEGVGMLVLKRLSAAERDGDHIYGLIRGTAENHGGRANSLTAPNPAAQAELLQAAYRAADVDPRSIGYIEAHGTGTTLGDPIEVSGLKGAFRALYQAAGAEAPAEPHCGLGSVKTNVGHLELAAGVAGVIKVLLQLKHQTLVKSLHCDEVNPYIDLRGSPFYVVQQTQPWPRLRDGRGQELPRRAGVSSFGFGGVNAHVVIEEYPAATRPAWPMAPGRPALVVLSAKDEERLLACAQQLLAAIDRNGWGDDVLPDLAYTLQVGRDAMDERLAMAVTSMTQLKEKLAAFTAGQAGIDDLYRGHARKNREALGVLAADEDMARTVDAWLAKGKLHKLLGLWVKGLAFDWNKLYGERRPRRMSLPTYPFARERHWVTERMATNKGPVADKAGGTPAVLHPLVHRNTSDFSEQRFSSRFSGEEFFLADHVVQGRRVLPGVAYLELAREALVQAGGADAGAAVRLRNVVWTRPVVVDQPVDVHVGLYPEDDGSIGFEIYSGDPAEGGVIHSRGRAEPLAAGAAEGLDVAGLRAQCGRGELAGAACYRNFASAGLDYGPAQQAIETIHLGDGQVLAQLRLPEKVAATAGDYVLHPSLLDAALQAVAALSGSAGAPQLALPFAVDEVVVLGRCADRMWAWVRVAADGGGERVRKYDVTLCDDGGVVGVQLRGFAVRPVDAAQLAGAADAGPADALTLLAPLWEAVTPALQDAPAATGQVLVVGGSRVQQEMLRRHFPQGQVAGFAAEGSVEALAAALATHGGIAHLVWIAPDAGSIGLGDDRVIAAQQDGVLQCFRLVKALLEAGYGARALEWSVFTTQTQAVHRQEAVNPAHAAVHGLVGSLAKEYPNWRVRLVDLPQDGAWPLAASLRLPPDAQGNGWAWRGGQWYRQQLLPVRLEADAPPPYRQGGVYVVIGGAGGIGEVWSEAVVRSHAAQVVWIGRRSPDAEIQAKIDRLGRLGPAPLYIAADAADRAALAQACRQVRQQFGAIHGVIHAAIVLRDQSLANMDEARFAASLSAKVDVSVRLAQVFGEPELNGDLDFVLFWSSLQSFSKAAGQSNYAAGCTFKDAFAQQLGRTWPCRVRVMNWGWWGSVGIVASPEYRQRMAQQGVASIEPEEGMAALAKLLGGRAGQLALLKTAPDAARRGPQPAEAIQLFRQDYPAILQTIDSAPDQAAGPEAQAEGQAFDAALRAMLGRLLAGQLQALGLRPGQQGPVAEVAAALGLRDLYGRWFEQTLRVLAEQGYLQFDGTQLSTRGMPAIDLGATWAEWESRKEAWLENPAFQAQVGLVETTLRALPDILTGKVPATDVMFPGSSMRLVEGIYQHNPVADYFNAVLADVVVAFVEARLRQDPQAKVRLLEIGAGTGGTSALLFERLRPYAAQIGEYCYTDLSKAFLFHAEKAYGPANPYLRYQLFDVSRPLAEQGLQAGSYDLVVATNVLHATANIRQSVRNAKAALRTHGLLLLNEISRGHVFSHLTFGLLEGWWLYEDPELRIPGCPGLSAEGWRRVLEDEGFAAVAYPAGDKEALGQQIIAAESDGVARQRVVVQAVPAAERSDDVVRARPAAVQTAAPVTAATTKPATAGGQLQEKAVGYFKGLLAKTLKLPVHKISSAESLEKYGIDSILVVEMTSALQGVFENVSSTLFFEYRTIDELAAHFIKTQPAALAKVLNFAPSDTVAAAPRQAVLPAPAAVAGNPRRFRNRVQPPSAAPQPPVPACREVAIIGISGRYAQARNLDEFWENLKAGRNCITEIPAGRWDHRPYFDPEKGKPGKTYTRWGGFIDGVDQFDPLFFSIAPREAEFMDPQERLFLAEAYASIEDAGYTPGSLGAGGKVGVFAGVMNSNYGSGTRFWSIANRVSYLFNFQGPSLAVDTACSSSLTALHVAMDSLRSGACEVALVGGVNLIIDPAQYVALSAVNMLSAGDRCRAFGAEADGFVDGEGVGVMVLKPLDQAVADGDQIYGVVKATAINHGGKTNGYTVPNPHAQAAVIARSLKDAGIDPRTLSYLEAHGTGTALGDPIEIAGLSKAFGEFTQDRQFCAIGSVKSNIGHCESAAGVAGIAKVLLQLKHGQLAPSLHAEQLNPHIDFAATPFVVQRALGEWRRPVLEVDGRPVEIPRRAGISSFGAGGSNAHVVIEEYLATAARQPLPASADAPVPGACRTLGGADEKVGERGDFSPDLRRVVGLRNENPAKKRPLSPLSQSADPKSDRLLVVLSARNEERLRERAQQLVTAIAAKGWADGQLADLAYTLQVGREAMDERLALLAASMSELKDKLTAWLAGEEAVEDLYRGQVKRNKEAMAVFAADEELQEAVAKWVERKKFGKVLDLWVKGLAFDWNRLYGGQPPQRMSLPTYPFARERYWLSRPATAALAAAAPATADAAERAAGAAGAGESLCLLVPAWQPEPQPAMRVPAAGGLLLVGGTPLQQDLLRRQYPQAQVADFGAANSVGEIADALAAQDAFAELIWIAPDAGALDAADDALIAAQQEGVLFGFRLVKALLEAGYGRQPLEWSVFTTQTQAVGPDEVIAPAHAGIHGLVGSLAKEYPNWRVRLADFPAGAAWPLAEALALPADPQGNSWAWRGGQWYRQQLQPAAVPAAGAVPYRQGGVYVVIGGAGGIGEAWSEHVIRAHGAQVVWIGRRPLDAGIQARIDRLARFGPAPHYIAADAGSRAALQSALDEVRQRFGPVRGLIHSALVLGDQALANMDEAKFAASLAAKVDVSVRLAQVFAGEPLDFVLFFSSLQSFARGAGQSNYAAGCAFKDAFAQHLAQRWPCPVKVMNWGWWGSVGVAAAPAYQARMKQLGLASIEPEEGWTALAQLLAGSFRQLALLKTAAPLPAARPTSAAPSPRVAQSPVAPAAGPLDDRQLHALGVAAFKRLVGELLHVPEPQIDASESLATYGIDSISVNQLCGLLAGTFADVNNALFFDYQTIDDLVAHFLATQRDALAAWVSAAPPQAEVAGASQVLAEVMPIPLPQAEVTIVQQAEPTMAPQAEPAVAAPPRTGGIAIVGIACRFPGADSVAAYWQLLQRGGKADNRGPARRWPEKVAESGERSPQSWGTFLDDIDLFDPGFFGIPPLQAEAIDPQERLFLMSCWHALEDAGYGNDKWLAERSRAGEDVGVFVGVTSASYNLIGFEQSLAGNPQTTGLSFASIANRVSHALGLTGPSLSVDTMCSSSLVALHMACESLRRNECRLAIAGGVNLNLHPSRLEAMAQARLICEDGESRSFGAGGQGFLAGEGVAAVVLKPLEAALQDGDTVHAVIQGSAIGHSGSTLNYFAPSSRGQGKVIARALESAGITADQVAYVEMQCVGDEATDAAEFEAIKSGYHTRQRAGAPLRLGSVKPNVGHAEAAAGMAQLIKVVLQLKHRTLVRTLLGEVLNPQLNFAGANLAVQDAVAARRDAGPTLMAINAFGAGGTAAHLIVESGADVAAERGDDGPQLLVLSARSSGALRRSAEALAGWLETTSQRLRDIAYTLQVGRREFNHRLALVAGSTEAALEQLRTWLADDAATAVLATMPEGVAPVPADVAAVQALAASGDWSGLARLWVGGVSIDWRKYLGARTGCRRVPLPGYAFDLRPCWPEGGRVKMTAASLPPVAAVLPAAPAPSSAVVPEAESGVEAAAGTKAGLLQSIVTPADAVAYLDEQVHSTAENLHLATVAILYAVMREKGVMFEERRGADGRLALYPRPAGGDPEATERLLERFLAANGSAAAGAEAAAGHAPTGLVDRLAGRAMSVAGRWLERLPGHGEKMAGRMLKLLPGAEGLTTAYLLKLLAKTPFLVADEAGLRLALPAGIRSRKQLDDLRSQYEISVRAMPEYQSYSELLAAIVSGILDGARPGPEQIAAASALLVDLLTVPTKLAFLNRLTADLCLAGRFAGRSEISVLAVGAGGFEFLSAIVAAAPREARIEYRVVSGWSQIAKGITELGRERFPGVSFVSFVPMVPGALAEHLGESRFDVVIVNQQDPCAAEAAGLLAKLADDPRESLVLVAEPMETQGLRLILDLTGMWPQVLRAPGMPDGQALGEGLVRAGYRRQVVAARLLSVFSREARLVEGEAAPTAAGEAELADIRRFLLQTFADAFEDGSTVDPHRNLADAGLPSMTWALVYARLQQRFGKVVEPGLFAEAGPDLSVESLARLLAEKLYGGEPLPPVPPIPEALAEQVMQHLIDAGQAEVALAHAAQLRRGEFTSTRGQVYEYFEYGSGPALVFLTALAFSKAVWDDQIREFGGQYRLIFPHLPGHAGSVYTGVGFTFAALADDLAELLGALEAGPANVVGWCIAGNIAQLLALRHPQRLKSLALVCTTPTDARMRGITQKDLEDYSVSPLLTYQMEFANIYHDQFLVPEVVRSLAIIKQTHVPVEPEALLSFISSLFQFDTRQRLHEIKAPTLVIAGSRDIAFPIDQVALLKDGIRHARFVAVEKGGHLPFLNEAALFNDSLRAFLEEVGGRRRTLMGEVLAAE